VLVFITLSPPKPFDDCLAKGVNTEKIMTKIFLLLLDHAQSCTFTVTAETRPVKDLGKDMA